MKERVVTLDRTREGQKGFTLIEMSIVLVIVGLLIGGVLKGQEMIDSTRLKSTISQVDAYRSALYAFQDRYGAVPGDYNLANARINATLINGNGNGLVVGAATGTVSAVITNWNDNTTVAGNEEVLFWWHLQAANMMSGTQVNSANMVFGEAAPVAKLSSAGFTIGYASVNGVAAHWLRLHRNATAPANALSGRQAFEVDQKVDDGHPQLGMVQNGTAAAASTCVLPVDGTTPIRYNATSNENLCVIAFQLM